MDLQSQLQDLLDLSGQVASLLQKQSDTLIRKKTLVNNNEEDSDNLSYDIALASRSLQILEIRRDIRTSIGELLEIKEKLENYGDNPSGNWFDYVQTTMESFHTLLKKGIEIASDQNPTFEQKSISLEHYKSPSLENILNNNSHNHCDIPQLRSDNSINKAKDRSISILVHKASDESLETIHEKPNTIRRHTMDSENVSAARLFIGNLGLKKSPPKASTTTFISPDQFCTSPARASTKTTIDKDLSVVNHLSQLIIHENEELDEFVDAVESQESNHEFGDIQINELTSLTKKCNNMKRTSSVYSLPTTLNTVFEDDSYSHMSDYDDNYDDNFSESSFDPSTSSSLPSPQAYQISTSSSLPSPQAYQISLNRCSRTSNLFAEKVTINNPMRMGTGIGSYIVYTCTVNGSDGSIVVRRRYSDFVKLRAQLIKAQPKYRRVIPNLPPKKIMGKFMPEFIEKRRKEIEYFLTYVLLHPVLGTTPVVRWWFMD